MHIAAAVLLTAFIISLVGVVLNTTCTLPSPYSGLRPVDIPKEMLEIMTPFPADFETGQIRENEKLVERAHRLYEGTVIGSECVSVSPSGKTLFMIDKFGYVHSADMKDLTNTLVSNITYIGPGRPLGFEAISDSELLVCDSLKGVLRVSLDKKPSIEILVNSVNYANDLHYDSANKMIYYTHSSERGVALDSSQGFYDTMTGSMLNLLHGKPSGALRKYSLETNEDSLIRGGMFFANGVTVSANGEYIFVVETFLNRVLKINIKTSEEEVFLSKLPAFPDGISRAPDGNLWLSLVTPLSPLVDCLPFPTMRLILSHLLPFVRKLVESHGLVVKVNSETSEIMDVLMDPTGERVASISSAVEYDNRLYLGNLFGDYISYVDLSSGN